MAIYTCSLVMLKINRILKIKKKLTVSAFLLQKFTVITKLYSAKENSQKAP